MDQQRSATVKHLTMSDIQMSTSGHNSCPLPKSPPINCLINVRLSVNQTLPQLINVSHRLSTDSLLWHCQDSVINRTEVEYVKKPQIWCYDEVRRLVTKQLNGCAHTLCWRAVLLQLKLVPVSYTHLTLPTIYSV